MSSTTSSKARLPLGGRLARLRGRCGAALRAPFGRREALGRLAEVYPGKNPAKYRRRLRAGDVQRGELRARARWMEGLSPKAFCKQLRLDGWEHLHAAERPLFLLTPLGDPRFARQALKHALGEEPDMIEWTAQGSVDLPTDRDLLLVGGRLQEGRATLSLLARLQDPSRVAVELARHVREDPLNWPWREQPCP